MFVVQINFVLQMASAHLECVSPVSVLRKINECISKCCFPVEASRCFQLIVIAEDQNRGDKQVNK